MKPIKKAHGEAVAKPQSIDEVRINLVKTSNLGITLRESATLSVIHQIINKKLTSYVDVDGERWWKINGRVLFDFVPLLVGSKFSATSQLIALATAKVIELSEKEIDGEICFVLRINNCLLD